MTNRPVGKHQPGEANNDVVDVWLRAGTCPNGQANLAKLQPRQGPKQIPGLQQTGETSYCRQCLTNLQARKLAARL